MTEFHYDEGREPEPGKSFVVERSFLKVGDPTKRIRIGKVWNGVEWQDFKDEVDEAVKKVKGMR